MASAPFSTAAFAHAQAPAGASNSGARQAEGGKRKGPSSRVRGCSARECFKSLCISKSKINNERLNTQSLFSPWCGDDFVVQSGHASPDRGLRLCWPAPGRRTRETGARGLRRAPVRQFGSGTGCRGDKIVGGGYL